MIPNYSAVAEVESTMMGEKVDMGVDEENLVHLMSILSDIYTDPTMAVAREYLTNAIDSHIEAGTTRPVEVTLPSVWQPNLIIQDFGIGMDKAAIQKTYSKYGASTKRESNDFNGMLGIGSKSAFAYTGAFTVVGIKNGIKTIVSVQRDAEGRPSMNILSETPTVEDNGVTITIPVDNPTRMERAMRTVTRYLPEGAVLVNGQDWSERKHWVLVAQNIEAPFVDEDGNEGTRVVIQNLWKDSTQSSRYSSRIVMGNVAYQMTDTALGMEWVDPYATLIAEIAIGEAVFAPSREKLMDVPKTREVEKFIVETFNTTLAKALYERVINAESRQKAMRTYHANRGVLNIAGYKNVQYKGEDIPLLSTRVLEYRDDYRLVGWVFNPSFARNSLTSQSMMTYASFADAGHVIVNAPEETVTANYRRKIKQYFKDDGKKVIILPERSVLDDKWLDDLDIVEYETVKAVKLPRPTRSGNTGGGLSTKGKHFVYDTKKGDYVLREVQDNEKVHYVVKRHVASDWNRNLFGLSYYEGTFDGISRVVANLLGKDEVLVHVYANRKGKLESDYPDAVELTQTDAHDMLVAYRSKDVTDDDIEAWAAKDIFDYYEDALSFLPDADAMKAKALSFNTDKDGIDRVNNLMFILPSDHDLCKKIEGVKGEMTTMLNEIGERYPLFHTLRYIRSNLTTEVIQRYFEVDYNKSQEDA